MAKLTKQEAKLRKGKSQYSSKNRSSWKLIKFQLLLFLLELGFAFLKFGLLLGQLCHILLMSHAAHSSADLAQRCCYQPQVTTEPSPRIAPKADGVAWICCTFFS
ncbi:unnamed protein product [Symbiodinium sp. KB8]|nr:unnamed protein product [Symbiodinium sp. KB8]